MSNKKMGRPANEKGLRATAKILNKNSTLSDRMIAKLIKDEIGKLPDPKSVWRWRKMAANL